MVTISANAKWEDGGWVKFTLRKVLSLTLRNFIIETFSSYYLKSLIKMEIVSIMGYTFHAHICLECFTSKHVFAQGSRMSELDLVAAWVPRCIMPLKF